ncbi:hypothetical protein Taro_013716, partial [Colocasia esculenta]|nr:hypothetical protein [Colocasia esculenta]
MLVLAKKYHKIVHVWDNITALAELWHPQTHTFIFPGFEATILLEELELMLGLPRYQRGEEHALSYTVALINAWSILGEITTRKTNLHSMTSRTHRKTGNHAAIAKAAAICICGVILFPAEDDAISFANLGIIDSLSEAIVLSLESSCSRFTHFCLGSVDTRSGLVDTSPRFQKTQLPDWDSRSTLAQGRDRSGYVRARWSFPVETGPPRPSRSFWGLHDTNDWRERAKEQIQNSERRGKQVKSSTTTDDAYLQAFALKYGVNVYKGARRQTASLRAQLYSAMQDREIAQQEAEQ